MSDVADKREMTGECRLTWREQVGPFTVQTVEYEGPADGMALEAFERLVTLVASVAPEGDEGGDGE